MVLSSGEILRLLEGIFTDPPNVEYTPEEALALKKHGKRKDVILGVWNLDYKDKISNEVKKNLFKVCH